MGELILVTGGARSGKSEFAEKLALQAGAPAAYLATAKVRDEEMRRRVERHRQRRGPAWVTTEEPLRVEEVVKTAGQAHRAVLLDCLGLWLANFLEEQPEEGVVERESLEKVRKIAAAAAVVPARVVVVTQEVGMGLVPPYPSGRLYRDLLGEANRLLAAAASEVYLLVAGLPIRLKGQEGIAGETVPNPSDYRMQGGRRWRRGFTTGSAAAAAAGAAAQALKTGLFPEAMQLPTPAGKLLSIPIAWGKLDQGEATCAVVKDGGDDPDVTSGLEVVARVRLLEESGLAIKGGEGVGMVTRPGLAVPPGFPAINPVPRAMIEAAVRRVLPGGAEVTVSVPRGAEVAKRTLNPRLGIEGGLSILGTTGIVEPMSEEAFRHSLVPQVSQAKAEGYPAVVLTPGRTGQRLAIEEFGLPERAIALMSNFVGFMLEECVRLGVKEVLFFGPIGKLAKVAAGSLNTHSRVSDGRREVMAALAASAGARRETVGALLAVNTTDEGAKLLLEAGMGSVLNLLAERASLKAKESVQGSLKIGTVLTSSRGGLLGLDKEARRIGAKLAWRL